MKIVYFFVLLLCTFFSNAVEAQPGRVGAPAPELTSKYGWLNLDSSSDLSLLKLRGKIVLLDFWTYCCINCMHVIPELKALENKYKAELVVIGVHSAKFENERDTNNIRQAVLRYGIEHPVVNDPDFTIWKSYDVHAWPTFVLIDPNGNIVSKFAGEGKLNQIDSQISELIKKHTKILNRSPLVLALEKDKVEQTELSFPGKIAIGMDERLYISDTNHNRIVVSDFEGNILDIIGNGVPGLKDGNFKSAEFNHPQGLQIQSSYLYVADTENHAIRSVDLKTRKVETLAGTGQISRDRVGGKAGIAQALNSPWDIEVIDRKLYIAMAGLHQLWEMDLDSKVVKALAGSGVENIYDGSFVAGALAQPSGVTSDGETLYVADSEVSAVRALNLKSRQITTLIGHGLFDFGDRDGDFVQAKLQHPLGLSYCSDKIYLADSYNHKIKELDLKTKRIKTLWQGDLSEPGGLAYFNHRLYISDTNNNKIRILDLKSLEMSDLQLHFNSPLGIGQVVAAPDVETYLPQQTLQKYSKIDFHLNLEFDKDFHLNEKAPSKVAVQFDDFKDLQIKEKVTGEHTTVSVDAPPIQTDQSLITVIANLYFCRVDGVGLCHFKTYTFKQPVIFSEVAGTNSLEFNLAPRPN